MCGLVGIFSSNMLNRHKEAMTTLLYLDTLRGSDSTGVAALRNNRTFVVHKTVEAGPQYVDDPRYKNMLQLNDYCWIGHNRFGTVGGRTQKNAHPFTVHNDKGLTVMVGAHNGTIKNRYQLDSHADFGTDSEAFLNQIKNKGLKETLAIADGAWALTYYDYEHETLNFIRNEERPFFFGYEDDVKTMIWASEEWMIRAACGRHGIKLKDNKVFSTKPDHLYTFPKPDLNKEIVYTTEGGLEGKPPPAVFHHGDPYTEGTYSHTYDYYKRESREDFWKNLEDKPDKKDLSLVGFSQSKKGHTGFEGKQLTLGQLQEVLDSGCSWCEDAMLTPKDKFGWLADDAVVCHNCLTGRHDLDTSFETPKPERKVN